MTPPPARVQLFATCLVDRFFPAVGHAAVDGARTARRRGRRRRRTRPAAASPPSTAGSSTRPPRWRGTRSTCSRASDDPVVVPSGSCADMIVNHYPELLAGDAVYGPKARGAGRADLRVQPVPRRRARRRAAGGARRPVARLPRVVPRPARPRPARAAAPPAARGRRRRAARTCRTPRPAAGSAACSPSRWAPVSARCWSRSSTRSRRSGADVVVATDVSCLMHIGGGLHRRGSRVRARHIAEVVADARP